MWFSVVCTLIYNGMRHHRGQNVLDSRGASTYTCQIFLSQMREIFDPIFFSSANVQVASEYSRHFRNIVEDIPMTSEHFRRYLKLFSQLSEVLKTLVIDTKEQRNIKPFFIYGIFRLTFLQSLDSNTYELDINCKLS